MKRFVFPVFLCVAGAAAADDLIRLPFLSTQTPTAGFLEAGLSHRFDGPIAPTGERNLFHQGLGMGDPGNTEIAAAYGISTLASASLYWETRAPWDDSSLSTAGAGLRLSLLREPEGAPLSLTASLNAQTRWNGKVESGKKYSGGGSVDLERSLFSGFSLSASLAGQSNTNVDRIGKAADHSVAWGLGLIQRGQYLAAFGEAVFPMRIGSKGFRRTYGTRAPDGIPDLAFGVTLASSRDALDVLCANTPSLLAANFLAGAGSPTPMRLMEWRLGLAYRHVFAISQAPGK